MAYHWYRVKDGMIEWRMATTKDLSRKRRTDDIRYGYSITRTLWNKNDELGTLLNEAESLLNPKPGIKEESEQRSITQSYKGDVPE